MTVSIEQRLRFAGRVKSLGDQLVALCVRLVQTASENPPGDTAPLAGVVEDALRGAPAIETQRIIAQAPAVNLMARVPMDSPGRRLVINSHLDTFAIGDASAWTAPPLGGTIRDGKIYGRGVSDMKAGLAAGLMTALCLAEVRGELAGELVLACVGDEETGGKWGTEYLLDHLPHARGDAMLSGDAGSPYVIRFGEKGQLWLQLTARGKSNHGAHVHLGENAIEALLEAIRIITQLRERPCPIPPDIVAAMQEARSVSEAISGVGEFDTLSKITVNVGVINGGSAVNIIPDRASALLDIRMPPGVTVDEVTDWIAAKLRVIARVNFEVLRSCDPNVTEPASEIARLVLANAKARLGSGVVQNMRVGMSDARFYRQRGIPTIVYGPAPYNMGGIDEHVTIEDLLAVFEVHAMTAYDYLSVR